MKVTPNSDPHRHQGHQGNSPQGKKPVDPSREELKKKMDDVLNKKLEELAKNPKPGPLTEAQRKQAERTQGNFPGEDGED